MSVDVLVALAVMALSIVGSLASCAVVSYRAHRVERKDAGMPEVLT